MASQSVSPDDVRVEVVTSPEDFAPMFEVVANAFGRQTADGIWMAANPGWDSPTGTEVGAGRMEKHWNASKEKGFTNFLKATVTVEGSPRIVGAAIWEVLSDDPEHGTVPAIPKFAALYPDDEQQQRYLEQLIGGLQAQRRAVVKEKALPESVHKAVMVLDLCVVDPGFQRRGIARNMVQWGLDEAQRRGGLEVITEASVMGRKVYMQMGFHNMGEIDYGVGEEFKDRVLPSNVFLRTAPPA
ncbi:hypothetical protein BX600DRAFT_462120 [Xylariales sp. PMI_506]|nr:hypothetical protein BX600DRAFT_462120 [Xylariales sp. PMI_506]